MEKQIPKEKELPIWNLKEIYSSFEDFNIDLKNLEDKISTLKEILTKINQDQFNIKNFIEILKLYNDIFELNRKLNAYIYCILACDSINEEANKYQGKLLTLNSTIKTIQTQIENLIFKNKELIISNLNEYLKEHEYFIKKSIQNFEHKMELNEEELYNLISISSNSEWKSLYDLIISNIKINFNNEILSISQLRNLYHHKDRTIRENVYNTEINELEKYEHIFAKILNSIKWDSIVISKKRKFNSLLEATLFYNKLDIQTFEIIINTTLENLDNIRNYFKIKAKLLNLDKLEWYDIYAPIIKNKDNYSDNLEYIDYEKAKDLILSAFSNFSSNLTKLAKEAFDNNWIDAKPRIGKSDGGFCIYVMPFKSRILVNYDNSIKSVFTLAHELGHAYHNYLLSNNLPIYRSSPLILAETASLLAENILRNYINTITTSKNLKILILDGFLLTVSQVVVDIMSRFLFEKKLVEIRKDRSLSSKDLINLMIDSQQEIYLDSINSFHKYMWIVKPHYYHSNFYNYPYLVGLLISLGLYKLYLEKKLSITDYERILSNTSKEDVFDLLIKYNINIKERDFWEKSFEFINNEILEFEKLANE
jgi:pepF/M3 family oligoendopeptidase